MSECLAESIAGTQFSYLSTPAIDYSREGEGDAERTCKYFIAQAASYSTNTCGVNKIKTVCSEWSDIIEYSENSKQR